MSFSVDRSDQINWNHVFYFSEIAATGSVKAAAEKLGMSSSTLSEHLCQLEADLSVKLFQRHHRRLQLTTEGARLFHSARQMFETGKRFIDLISPTPFGSYPISIGIVPGSSYTFAHGIIRDFIKLHNDVSAHVLTYKHDDLESAILGAKLDFGFTDRRSTRKNIIQSTIVASELNFFVSSDLESKELREHLLDLPLIICRSDGLVPSVVEEVLDSVDLIPKNVIVSEYPSLVESLCKKGAGVAVLGRLHFENDPSIKMLKLPRDFPNLTERLYATWLADGENSEAIRRLKPLLSSPL
jgi:DNA-binding transcriptional LysR family regulator